jgi:hypothetical protein
MPNLLKQVEVGHLQMGDTVICNDQRYFVIQIEDDVHGHELRLKDAYGVGKVKFVPSGERITIEL